MPRSASSSSNIAVGQPEAQIPADRQHDHLGWEPEPGEIRSGRDRTCTTKLPHRRQSYRPSASPNAIEPPDPRRRDRRGLHRALRAPGRPARPQRPTARYFSTNAARKAIHERVVRGHPGGSESGGTGVDLCRVSSSSTGQQRPGYAVRTPVCRCPCADPGLERARRSVVPRAARPPRRVPRSRPAGRLASPRRL